MVKNLTASAEDTRDAGSILGKIPGRENGNPLQYSCLENSMDRRAWWATVHGVAKSQAQLSAHVHNTPLYHIFFIHSFVDEHLGCFHVLAIVNSASMNIRMQAKPL